MATNVIYDYGNAAGPSSWNYFQAFVGIRIAETSTTAYRLEYNHAIWVDGSNPNFGGTSLKYEYSLNGSEVNAGKVSLYGKGWYADTGWVNGGWYSSGQTMTIRCYGYYTSGSVGFLKSTIDRSYTVPQLQQAPDEATSCTLTKNSDTSSTMSWDFSPTSNKPVTSQQRAIQTNDGLWVYTDISNGTTKSAAITTTTNSKYYAAIELTNSSGSSGWKYSNIIYTTPPAPIAYGLQNGTAVSCSADGSATKYISAYEWQYSDDGSTWTAIAGTDSTISHTTSAAAPQYRVRVKNLGDVYSSWTTFIPSKNKQLFINVPDGKSIQGIYIWK